MLIMKLINVSISLVFSIKRDGYFLFFFTIVIYKFKQLPALFHAAPKNHQFLEHRT